MDTDNDKVLEIMIRLGTFKKKPRALEARSNYVNKIQPYHKQIVKSI